MIRIFLHALKDRPIRRITNLGGFVYADCGCESHFADLRRRESTRMRAIEHLTPEEQSIAQTIAVNVSAYLDDTGWSLESFEDEEPALEGALVALTPEALTEIFPEIATAEAFWTYRSASGGISILRSQGGIGRLPIWLDRKRADEAQAMFPDDKPHLFDRSGCINLLDDLCDQGLLYVALPEASGPVYYVALVPEFLSVLTGDL